MEERPLGEFCFTDLALALHGGGKVVEVKFERPGHDPDWYAVKKILGFEPPQTVICKLSYSPIGFNGVSLKTPARIRDLAAKK